MIGDLENIDDVRLGNGCIVEVQVGCDSTVRMSRHRTCRLSIAFKHMARERATTANGATQQACQSHLARVVKRHDSK